jgi:hypothetical protein
VLAAVVLALAQEPAEGKKYALLVGVSRHDGSGLSNLKYAEKDAADLKAALEALEYKVTLVTRSEFKRTDLDHLDPTAENIRDHLAAITRNRKPEDTVLVAFSGQGVHLKATNKLYYCPAKVNLAKLETLVAIDDVMAALKRFDPQTGTGCKANSKVLLMDACRNDPSDGRAATDGKLASLTRPLVPDPPGGTVALFSCSKGQISHESEKFERGFLTHYVIDGLTGKAANPKTGVVSWDKLVAHVKEEVPAAVIEQKDPKADQLPESLGRVNVLALGRVAVAGSGGSRTGDGAPEQGGPKVEGKTYVSKATGMKFVRIPKGTFTMGSPKEEGGDADEQPSQEVTLTKDFYLGVYEVTRGQFRKFVDDAGYRTEAEADGKGGFAWDGKEFKQDPKYTWRSPGFEQTDDHPVVNVSWNDAVKFAEWLSKKDGREYRLPTEAEWEYSCSGWGHFEIPLRGRRQGIGEVQQLRGRLDQAVRLVMDRCDRGRRLHVHGPGRPAQAERLRVVRHARERGGVVP